MAMFFSYTTTTNLFATDHDYLVVLWHVLKYPRAIYNNALEEHHSPAVFGSL